ncbi:MAG: hypothetical protein J6W64_11010 [Bacilli bacterium]|nr:hypothetical protein [Bacilli bacterium]
MMDFIKNMLGKMNPQQIVMNMIKNNSNPIIANLISMAQQGDTAGVENFARNYLKENGKDYDSEFSNFMNNFK